MADAPTGIVVTGASGFIGLHVLRQLQQQGIRVTAVTRRADRLKEFEQFHSVFEADCGDLTSGQSEILGQHGAMLHLAWDGLPNYRSLHHLETELPAQYRFLKSMVAGGLKSIVVAGTCFEYGMQSGPLSEELPVVPDNPYGYAKDALRRQLTFLKREKDFNFTWARLFYMYGSGQAGSSLLSQLEAAVKRGDKQFNMSGGEQLRDFLPVETVARSLVALLLRRQNDDVVNICSGQPRSVRGMVEDWLAEHNWQIELNLGHYPYPDYEPMAFWGDNGKLSRILAAGSDAP